MLIAKYTARATPGECRGIRGDFISEHLLVFSELLFISATWSYITSIIASNVQYLSYVGFYAHNDMDMMEIGNGALTAQEQRTHFAAWAFLKSPILLGTDVSSHYHSF